MSNHDQLTAREIHGPYVQLLTNLQGAGGREWLVALNKFLHKENPWPKKASDFDVWKSVTVGVHPILESYLNSFKGNKIKLEDPIPDDIEVRFRRCIKGNLERQNYDLVKVSLAALGFKSVASHRQLLERIRELKFYTCNLVIPLALRLAYLEQEPGEMLHAPMEGITFMLQHYVHNDDEEPGGKKSGLYFGWDKVGPYGPEWQPQNVVVLVRPTNT